MSDKKAEFVDEYLTGGGPFTTDMVGKLVEVAIYEHNASYEGPFAISVGILDAYGVGRDTIGWKFRGSDDTGLLPTSDYWIVVAVAH